MLAGVDQQRLDGGSRGRGIMFLDGPHERGYLHEVGAGGRHQYDFHLADFNAISVATG
jgi:hypothetical protein